MLPNWEISPDVTPPRYSGFKYFNWDATTREKLQNSNSNKQIKHYNLIKITVTDGDV